MKYPKSSADLMLFRSAPVHAVDQRRQLRRGQRQRLSRFDARRPQKDAVREPFGEQAESGSIPIYNLDEVGPGATAEYEQVARERILMQHALDQHGEYE